LNLLPIDLPPGVFRQGTEYQSGGRWWNANLVRWFGRQLGPVGGWQKRSGAAVPGLARAILPWVDNAGGRWIAIGSHTRLQVQNASGAVFDITPAGFSAGAANETANTGYGVAAYGAGAFGAPRPDTGTTTPALVWDLDTWGQDLLALAHSDGRIVRWQRDTLASAAVVANAPTGCYGVTAAEQGFVIALGAGGDPRKVQWSDQNGLTSWTPSSTNQAGSVSLATAGKVIRGVRLGPAVLVLTDADAHLGQYVGLPYVWSFARVAHGCGATSKGCAVSTGSTVVWWSKSGFWIFDGAARPVECEVWDFLANNLNPGQRSKISGFHNSQFGEVWWFYPSAGSNENDSYVYWDYRRDHWGIGTLARLCAAEPSVYKWPLAMGADGCCYEHETGAAHDGAAPFAETGPIELGGGEAMMRCSGIVGDDAHAGDVTVSFRTRPFPDGPETVLDETVMTSGGFAELRFAARQARMRVTQANGVDWRFGRARLELSPGGRR
jgi:hypothetical protein